MPYVEISTNTPCHYIALDIKGTGANTWGNNKFVAYQNDFSTPLVNPLNIDDQEDLNNWTLAAVSELYAGATFVGTATTYNVTSINGIWKFNFDVEGNTGDALDNPIIGIALTCDVDCCIANKMHTYLNKSCDNCKSKKCCDKDLEEIYKIYMLVQAAKIKAGELDFEGAYQSYMQAKTLCSSATSSCDCNCS